MAFRESEKAQFEATIASFIEANRPPEHIRAELDWAYRCEDQSFVLFEVRPDWRDKTQRMESPYAKVTYVRNRKQWKIFWLRADLRWHAYDPNPTAKSLAEALRVIREDKHHCFFG